MNGPLELLRAGVVAIAQPSLWTQGALARDVHGQAADPLSPAAACRCSLGALRLAERQSTPLAAGAYDVAWDALDRVASEVAGMSIVGYQDAPERTHAEVLDVWHRAIAALAERSRMGGD